MPIPGHVRPAVPIKGIMKLHFLGFQNGSLKTKAVSCLECLQKGSECENCGELSPFKSAQQLQALLSSTSLEENDGDEEEEQQNGEELEGVAAEGDSDSNEDSGQEESCDEDSTDIHEGVFVWAPFGRRMYPAQVVSLASVPINLHNQLQTKQAGQVTVKWVGEVDHRGEPVDRFSPFSAEKLKLLGDSAMDHSLAKRCPMKYYEALNQALTPS